MVWPFTKRQPETRGVTQSTENFFEVLGLGYMGDLAGQHVTENSALGVPAVFAAVNFIASSVAGLPLNLYRREGENRIRQRDSLASVLHDAVNEETTSFDWRKYTMERVLLGGRGLTQIVRNVNGRTVQLVPLDPSTVTIERVGGVRRYRIREAGQAEIVLPSRDVIDLPFMLRGDGVGHISPITSNKPAIARAQAVQAYANRFFDNGGVPPFALIGNYSSGGSMDRAAADLHTAAKRAAEKGRQFMALPTGMDIKTLGTDAQKNQLLETQRFCVEEIARIYSLPPVFLQDLTHGTYSNTEQQDLHLAKHTVKRWVDQIEKQINLKLFGFQNGSRFVEFNMDGLLRGDFQTRMSGYAQAIQNGVMMPNEARKKENLPEGDGGDGLYIQGATVPLSQQQQGADNEA